MSRTETCPCWFTSSEWTVMWKCNAKLNPCENAIAMIIYSMKENAEESRNLTMMEEDIPLREDVEARWELPRRA